MARRLALALLFTLTAAAAVAVAAQTPVAQDLQSDIAALGAFQYPVRMEAARAIRRVPAALAVPALVAAVEGHADQFVRYRALVLLAAFNDRTTPDLMRSLLADRNDRVREIAYQWFAARPDPALVPRLLAALQTEQAEFVRPALVAALAALDADASVQRALIAEAGRGLDFFRIAVIEALGERRAAYAVDTLASVVMLDGPIQDDAVIALGRIGGARAATVIASISPGTADVTASLHAARCMLGDDCAAHLEALVRAASDPSSGAPVVRASVAALGAVAARLEGEATDALFGLARASTDALREEAGVACAVLAVRVPAHVLAWLDAADDADHVAAIEALRVGFERLEEDFAEEQFFAAARAVYWRAAESSPTRARLAGLLDTLEF